jgi:GNAT superfamily N-acetyltransferase
MQFSVRRAVLGDEEILFALVLELARFEKLEHRVTGSAEGLRRHLFGSEPRAAALLAESAAGEALGFALFFSTFSTFLTRPGLYLEDLFVIESARGRGVGRALLREVSRIARDGDAGRLEWAVLDWNTKAIDFYRANGATVMRDWHLCRVTEDGLERLIGTD